MVRYRWLLASSLLAATLSAPSRAEDDAVAVVWYRASNDCPDGWLTADYCAGNLALSTCEASISELVDCLLGVVNYDGVSAPGCGHYFEKPGCSGTLVKANDYCQEIGTGLTMFTDACSVRVE